MIKIIFWILQKIIDIVGLALSSLIGLLPNSPFSSLASSPMGDLLSKINFFVPIYEFVAIIQAWLVCVAVYYVYSIFARWIKAID